jgi:uncharacterized protein (TIGR03437 family)
MRIALAGVVFALTIGPVAFAQTPVITAVLDAAAYTPNIAQGQVFVVKGNNLAASSASASVPYPASIGGIGINFTPTSGGAPVAASMVYTYSAGGVTQLAAVLPTSTAIGNYNVTVVSPAGTSAAFPVVVVARKFGLITVNGSGTGRALIQNYVSSTELDLNRFTTGSIGGVPYSPAKPGQTLIAYGTGLNSVTPIQVTVTVGTMQISATGVAQGQYPGLDQVNVTLPANVPTGCFLQFQITVGGQASNATTVSIAPNASATACVDPNYSQSVLASLDQPGGHITIGSFTLESLASTVSVLGNTTTSLDQLGAGLFAQYTADEITSAPASSASTSVSTGGCQVSQMTYTVTAPSTTGAPSSPPTTPAPSLVFLDAGPVSLSGPNINNQPFMQISNLYDLSLGTPGSTTSVLAPGTYTITGQGGKDVGPFTASLNVDTLITVTGGLPTTIPRGQNLTIPWTPATGSDLVEVVGSSLAVTSGTVTSPPYTVQYAFFYCTTTTGAGSITVPSSVLSQLPATPGNSTLGFSELTLISTTLPSATVGANGNFTAPLTAGGSINYGYFFAESGTSVSPVYQ